MTNDKIAQALNMRPLDEAQEDLRAEFEEQLEKELNDHAREVNSRVLGERADWYGFAEDGNKDLVVQESVDSVKNLPQKSVAQVPAAITKEAEENLKDIELAKQNIENIINLGDDAVKEMTAIAKQSESPRAFEVVSTLMKTLLDANKDYVEMSTKKRYAKEEGPSTQVTNNNLIVSTADLLKMIKGDNNE